MIQHTNQHYRELLRNIRIESDNVSAGTVWAGNRIETRYINYELFIHYHPYTDHLIEKLNTDGLEAFMDVNYHQQLSIDLDTWYKFGNSVALTNPKEVIDVSDSGPYSVYNWELFFHAPLTIAIHLSKNQRFAEAQRWFHFIFDPTSNDTSISAPQRFWKFLRFRNETKTEFIDEMMTELAKNENNNLKERMEQNIQAWRDKPFQPHVIARNRYLAYQINVVMKYLDNLIAWGDSLFRQESLETLNEATQIYVLAAAILGPKPQKVPARNKRTPKTYRQLKDSGIDAFGNALVKIENDFPFNTSQSSSRKPNEAGSTAAFGIGRSLYFCIPQNDKLLTYWDTVDDRLYKLRHCMNLQGVVRQLPLFDPPIDPGMLVKAAAAGISLGSIISNMNQPLSTVRGNLLLQKAVEVCNEVKSLGQSLLSALEKEDAENYSLLRQQHEIKIQSLVQDVKYLQWKEAEASTESLLKSRNVTFERYKHYKLILGNDESDIDKIKTIELARKDITEENFDEIYSELVENYSQEISRENYRKETTVGGLMEFAGEKVTGMFGGEMGKTLPLNKNEDAELNVFLPSSDVFSIASIGLRLAVPLLSLIPQFSVQGTPLGVGGVTHLGGKQLSAAAKGGAKYSKEISDAFMKSANRASRLASYYRRAEDYVLQANQAAAELTQYGKQIITSIIREQIAKKAYEQHLVQIENSKAEEEFLKDKFTNNELYSWMQGELSKIFFDSYKFAHDIAKRAEQTMKHELMRKEFDELNFIRFGYWDSARKGLLSGEALFLDLKRLEMAYHDHNKREYEITKHISVKKLDPIALLKLVATGSCELEIPEWLYDMDSPGQYMRRIKTVSLSIPCITGSYTSIHCKLSLLQSQIRNSSLLSEEYARAPQEDSRFRDFNGTIQSVITSNAQDDSGMFETNLRDERYLPFEGAGAISRWKLEIPNDIPQFNIESVTDVVLHVRYTCREAGHLKEHAITNVKENVLQLQDNMLQLFGINSDFGAEWHQFTHAENEAERSLSVNINSDMFPYWATKLGMEDELTATFCVINEQRKQLSFATQALQLTGDANMGWNLTVDENSPEIFNFLKRNKTRRVYMAISYTARS